MSDTTYRIVIKHDDDTLHDTKFSGLCKELASEAMQSLYATVDPLENWVGLAVTDDNGDVYEEMEW